ncbi:UNVERIFIED_CONTAM: hypothetical protein PYX00_009184 [Menopon gallinae]|uniref:Serine/threonine-protein phosphatase 4 regulatory subunit 2 n=1 Tax=Menopon gallinae TaxID=328185 RepID=A0AAW2HAC7_9NEOP
MENPEEVLNLLDEFAKVKSKDIPNDLEKYLLYVAASGDPVYQWSLIKSLYRQKLLNVITEFYETYPTMDTPAVPNVDPFNYETMKNSLLERLDSFASAPFTIQRISELLTTPTKQYNRVDKFMRAIEKNIWVVSTREPGQREQNTAQEAAGNLVNGVASRVRVTVKHPKRGKSIEERIKSGHPQLIDDDEEDEEEDEPMEAKSNSEILSNNDSEDTPLQCTSVKDLLEKYENGTIFCGTEEKTVQLEESAVPGEAVTSTVAATTGCESIESTSEQESHIDEVEEDDPMEAKSDSELLPTTETEDTPLECTSLKDLLEKQENGTMFCENEEKTVQLEESAMPVETSEMVTSTVAVAAESSNIESTSEQETQEDREEEDEPMNASVDSELLANSEDTPIECTSLKDLLDKQESATMFCENEEKTVQLEESAVPGETVTSTVDVTTGSESIESTSETETQEEEGGNILSHYMLNEQS